MGLSDTQIMTIPTWGYDTSIEPLCALNTCWIRWSPESAHTIHPVAPWIPTIPTTNKHHHCNHTTLFVCHCMGHIHIRSLAISFRWLVWPNTIEFEQMVLTPHNERIRSSNQVAKAIIDNCGSKSYLLATLYPSGVIILPLRSCHTICDCCTTLLNSYIAL